MAGKFEIKAVVTGASQGAEEIKKISDALDKLTEAEKRVSKSAKDSADVFKKALAARNDPKDQQQYLSGLTQEAKAHEAAGAAAKQAAGIKGTLLEASKKLQAQIPGLSFVIGSLKNPFTALIAVIALTMDSLSQMKQRMDDLKNAVGDGKITTNFQNIGKILAESKVNATQLVEELNKIKGRPENTQERADRQRADMERSLKVEAQQDEVAKAGELAVAADPAARAVIEAKFARRAKVRDQRRLAGEANILAQAQVRAQDIVRAGVAAQPEEEALLAAAKRRHNSQMALAEAQVVEPDDLKTLMRQRDELKNTLDTPMLQRSVTGLQLTSAWRGDEGMREGLAMLNEQIAGAQAVNRNVGFVRRMADADLEFAEARYQGFVRSIAGSQEEVRSFGIARGAAVADAAAFQPFNDPAGARVAADSRAAQAAFEEFIRRVILITNEGQQQVNAISRANASQSQQ